MIEIFEFIRVVSRTYSFKITISKSTFQVLKVVMFSLFNDFCQCAGDCLLITCGYLIFVGGHQIIDSTHRRKSLAQFTTRYICSNLPKP